MTLPEVGDRAKIWRVVRHDHHEIDPLIGGSGNMPRGGRRSTTFQKGTAKAGPGRSKKPANETAKAILKTAIADAGSGNSDDVSRAVLVEMPAFQRVCE
jgi:hypothetical protein